MEKTYHFGKTTGGKPKVTDKHGFAIATGPDATKSSVDHINFLIDAGNHHYLLVEALKQSIKEMKDLRNGVPPGSYRADHTIAKCESLLSSLEQKS